MDSENKNPSTKQTSLLLRKALPNEPIFTLLARDAHAPKVICEWIKESIYTQPPDKLHAALDVAIAMADQRDEIVDKKTRAENEDRRFRTDQLG